MISNILILLTKLGIVKWRKRIFIENIFFDDEKYLSFFLKKKIILNKTSVIFPESCNLHIYNSNSKYYNFKFCGVSKLFDYLEKQNCKMWIPDEVLKNDRLWCKDNKTKRIVRKYKFQELNDNIRKSKRWFTRYKKIHINR